MSMDGRQQSLTPITETKKNNMKRRDEILRGRYTIESNGMEFVFSDETPKACANKIVELYHSQTRVVLDYGDIATNKSWGETNHIKGRIGLSKGWYDLMYPILIHNSRSSGGTSILTNCILSIKESKGEKLIYKN